MTSKKEKDTTPSTNPKRPAPPSYSPQEKVQAILAVWTERCRPADVCRQLRINYMTFLHWQRGAMEGMLQALENRVNLANGEALSPRLQALLQRQQRSIGVAKLNARREQIQLAKSPSPPPQTE
jgi:transposase-like protein